MVSARKIDCRSAVRSRSLDAGPRGIAEEDLTPTDVFLIIPTDRNAPEAMHTDSSKRENTGEVPKTVCGLWEIAASDPDRTAVIGVDGSATSYAVLAAHSNQLARALAQLGLRRGDRLALMMRNAPAMLEITLAATQSGLYVVPVNFHGTADDIAYIVEDSAARAFFTDAAFGSVCKKALDTVGFGDRARFCVGDAPGFRNVDAWRSEHSGERPAEAVAGSVMYYTSGTTGRPKGVLRPLPDRDADAEARAQVSLVGLFGIEAGPGAHLVNSPLYHTAVMNIALSALHAGQTLILMDDWEPERALELIERYRVSSTHMVATHFHRLLALPDEVKARYDTTSLRHVLHGAVPTPVHVKKRMLDWWGPVIYEYYGSSEVGGTMVGPEQWLAKPGTVGRPFPMTRLEILDDEGKPVPRGARGWIYMQQGEDEFGYHNDPQKTAGASRGKLVCVGDIGYVDEDGYLFLCGRDAEIIISGGVNIYPAAAEGCMLGHPAVRDVAVVGVPDEEFGEQVKAVVVPEPGYAAGERLAAELIEHCRERLSHIDCPRSVDFVDELPRDPSGKLYKQRVRERYWEGRGREI